MLVLSEFAFQPSYPSFFSSLSIPLAQFGWHITPRLNLPMLFSLLYHMHTTLDIPAFHAWCYCKIIYQLDRIKPQNRIIYTFAQLSPTSTGDLRLFGKFIYPTLIDLLVSSLLLATHKLEIRVFKKNIFELRKQTTLNSVLLLRYNLLITKIQQEYI